MILGKSIYFSGKSRDYVSKKQQGENMKRKEIRKFTRDELKMAMQQIREEKEQTFRRAQSAAEYLEEILGIENCCRIERAKYYSSNYEETYVLSLVHQTYGPYLEDFTSRLAVLPNAHALKEDEKLIGYYRKDPQYEITTEFGTYFVVFEYFNNHGSGWYGGTGW